MKLGNQARCSFRLAQPGQETNLRCHVSLHQIILLPWGSGQREVISLQSVLLPIPCPRDLVMGCSVEPVAFRIGLFEGPLPARGDLLGNFIFALLP
jgi:hypothetical protein